MKRGFVQKPAAALAASHISPFSVTAALEPTVHSSQTTPTLVSPSGPHPALALSTVTHQLFVTSKRDAAARRLPFALKHFAGFIVQELQVWTADFALPATVWLAGFFNPQSFLTAIMQSTARKNEWPLDKMCLSVEVSKKNRDDIRAPPREGSYVHGLFMEGKSAPFKRFPTQRKPSSALKVLANRAGVAPTGCCAFVQLRQKLRAVELLLHADARDAPAEGSTRPVHKAGAAVCKRRLRGPSWGLGCPAPLSSTRVYACN